MRQRRRSSLLINPKIDVIKHVIVEVFVHNTCQIIILLLRPNL
jgi:hypothetical protein